MTFPSTIDKSTIPHRPGVYIYRDEKGKILYVGKAIDLYHRVSSYFNRIADTPKTAALVERIVSVETIEVLSELEALVLEANLIKRHCPPYNIKLTDDKDYLYVKITQEAFPKIITARKGELADAKEYFGPFPSSRTVRETLKKLRRIFPWCAQGGKPFRGRPYFLDNPVIGKTGQRPCFYYHLGLCPGACAGKITSSEYAKIIKRFSKFMRGEKEELFKDLQQEMEESSQQLDFERAQTIKKTIEGLGYLIQPNHAQVYLENPNFLEDQNKEAVQQLKDNLSLNSLPQRIECYDVSNFLGQQAVGSLVVLTWGDLDKKWYRKFKIKAAGKPNDVGMMKEMLSRRLKHDEWPKPDLILVDGGKGQVGVVAEEVEKKGWKVPVFGLAKRMEWLYSADGQVIKISRSSLSLRLLQKIRDEAHRFAITYHRKLRSQNFLPVVY